MDAREKTLIASSNLGHQVLSNTEIMSGAMSAMESTISERKRRCLEIRTTLNGWVQNLIKCNPLDKPMGDFIPEQSPRQRKVPEHCKNHGATGKNPKICYSKVSSLKYFIAYQWNVSSTSPT
jgi:hypothetical protein